MTSTPSRRDKSIDLNLVGTTIAGKYRVLQVLGQGGFGSVFLVEIVAGMVGEKLALKLLPTELSQDEKVKSQFINEIRVAMRMVNKYIIQVRDVGETESGQLYYTMDYCPGETLATVLKREGALSPLRVIPIALRILEALKTAHAAGVIHRDLKPANVMVFRQDNHETARVLDFGIATAIRAGKNNQDGGKFLGSPHYMPPEQFLNEELGFFTDTYSVGVILYECLTGQKPYPGRNAQEVYNELKRRPVIPPDQIQPELAAYPELSNIICKALERNPDLRYPSAKEFFTDLKAILEALAEPPPPPPPPIPAAARRRRTAVLQQQTQKKSSAAGVLLGVSMAVAVISVALFIVWKSGQNKTGTSGSETVLPAQQPTPIIPAVEPPFEFAPVEPAEKVTKPPSKKEEVEVTKKEPPPPPPMDPKDKAREILAQAAKLARLGTQWSKVLELSKEAILLHYEDSEGHRLKGISEIRLGMYEEALGSFKDTKSRISPDKLDANLLLLMIEAQEGRTTPDQMEISKLTTEALEILEREPQNREAALKLLDLLDRQERVEEVAALLKHVEAQNWNTPVVQKLHQKYFVDIPKEQEEKARALLAEAKAAFNKADFAQAEEKAQEAYRLKALPELGFLLAETYLLQRKAEELQPLLGGLAKSSSDPEELARIGTLYGRTYLNEYSASGRDPDLEKAFQNLDAALKIMESQSSRDRDNHLTAAIYTYRARGFALQGNLEQVDDQIKEARKFHDRDVELIYHQAESYSILGERLTGEDRTDAYLRAVARLTWFNDFDETKRDPRGYFLMGLCYLQAGGKTDTYKKACDSFAKAQRGMKDNPRLFDAWGDAYLAQGIYIRAGQKYRESFHLKPTEDSCAKAAKSFIEANSRSSAEEILREGLKKFPKSNKLRQLLSSITR